MPSRLNRTGVLAFISLLLFAAVIYITVATMDENKGRCNCSKSDEKQDDKPVENPLKMEKEGFETLTVEQTKNKLKKDLQEISDQLAQISAQLLAVCSRLVIDKNAASFEMVNLSGHLSNISFQISQLSGIASVFSSASANIIVAQMANQISNELGHQCTVLSTASNNLMIWSKWVLEFDHMNDIPTFLSETKDDLDLVSTYLTNLAVKIP